MGRSIANVRDAGADQWFIHNGKWFADCPTDKGGDLVLRNVDFGQKANQRGSAGDAGLFPNAAQLMVDG